MEHNFWHQRWSEGRIGFHQKRYNSRLVKLWPTLDLAPESTVLVPLCGKTLDIIWLEEQGYNVIGVELSEQAIRDFFTEQERDFTTQQTDDFLEFRSGNITLLCGDFFKLTTQHYGHYAAIYDRAALVALPENMRSDYANHCVTLLRAQEVIFLISMTYDQEKMKGPPFSVNEEEIRTLFSATCDVDVISQSGGPDIVGNLSVDTLDEQVYQIKKR